MNQKSEIKDAVIIGGGFYGVSIALYLIQSRQFKNVTVLEKEDSILKRASRNNQARVHNGYHYPRSFTTAYRSRINLPKFATDWPLAVKKDFTQLYAIARKNSKVTSKQFERFCQQIGADLKTVTNDIRKLFETRLIENVYEVQEYAFNYQKIAENLVEELKKNQIDLRLNTEVVGVSESSKGYLEIETKKGPPIHSLTLFNCTYSGLNQLGGQFQNLKTQLKHEITEMALVQMPPQLENKGVTVMDGPFFSMMPYPATTYHTFSHVRYTPHQSWPDSKAINPYNKLAEYDKVTRFDRMVRDVARYVPVMAQAQYAESLFEVKTVLVKNENDDGRPILFEKHPSLKNCYSILGGKIDNIYDVLEKLDAEKFEIN